jgi:hypothetical protein
MAVTGFVMILVAALLHRQTMKNDQQIEASL